MVFNNYRLMQVKSIAECSKGSIQQYFQPSLSYHFPLRHLFCQFLSGRLRQVLLSENCYGLLGAHDVLSVFSFTGFQIFIYTARMNS